MYKQKKLPFLNFSSLSKKNFLFLTFFFYIFFKCSQPGATGWLIAVKWLRTHHKQGRLGEIGSMHTTRNTHKYRCATAVTNTNQPFYHPSLLSFLLLSHVHVHRSKFKHQQTKEAFCSVLLWLNFSPRWHLIPSVHFRFMQEMHKFGSTGVRFVYARIQCRLTLTTKNLLRQIRRNLDGITISTVQLSV